jgi:hypothetical protein
VEARLAAALAQQLAAAAHAAPEVSEHPVLTAASLEAGLNAARTDLEASWSGRLEAKSIEYHNRCDFSDEEVFFGGRHHTCSLADFLNE